MKKLLKNLCVFLALLLLLSLCVDYVVTAGLRKSDIRKYAVWNDIFDSAIDADVLIMGSSETWCGYNTYIIDSLLNCNSYNIAIDGHAFRYQLLRYNTYRRFCPRPNLIILNLDIPGILGDDKGYAYEREQFFPYIMDDLLIDQVASDKKITVFDKYLPLYRYYGYRTDIEDGFRSYFGRPYMDGGMHKGYRGEAYSWEASSLSIDSLFEAPNDSKTVSLINDFVQAAKDEGIGMVFVEFPEYYQLREKFSNVSEVEASFNKLASENQIPILDYSFAEICYDSTLYRNPSHLNKKGSELFTFKLCHDLDSLGLLK
jgi:hypothetical protein